MSVSQAHSLCGSVLDDNASRGFPRNAGSEKPRPLALHDKDDILDSQLDKRDVCLVVLVVTSPSPPSHLAMADKHIFADHTTLINRSLRGVVASNPTLRLIPSLRVVYNPQHPRDEIATICGGGGGHEPASAGCECKSL